VQQLERVKTRTETNQGPVIPFCDASIPQPVFVPYRLHQRTTCPARRGNYTPIDFDSSCIAFHNIFVADERESTTRRYTMRQSMFSFFGFWFVFFVCVPRVSVAAPPTDACSLISQSQLSAALGVSVGAGKPIASGKSCQWRQPPAKPGDEVFIVDVTIVDMHAFEIGKAASAAAGPSGPKATPISGLGDDAYYYVLGQISEIRLKKGNSFLGVRVSGGKKPLAEYEAKEKAVAAAIVPKL